MQPGPTLRCVAVTLTIFLAHLPLWAQTATPFKVSPASLAFTYLEGDAKLPAAATLAVAGTAGTSFTATLTGGGWLTLSAVSGTLPASIKVLANPTSLTAGTYSASIALVTAGASAQSLTVPVTLTITQPPPSLSVSGTSFAAEYARGQSPPAPLGLTVATSGTPLAFTASAAGAAWLTVSPRSGLAFPAFPASLTMVANPVGLAPGIYKATLTVTAPQSANKTQTVSVTFSVGPGIPTIQSVWPVKLVEGAASTTVTLSGSNFYSGTVFKAGTVVLASSTLGDNAATAVLPAALLASAGTLTLTAANPGALGGESPASGFTVAPATPVLAAAVHGASFRDGPIAPGQLVTLFGTRLGPDVITSFDPPLPGLPIASTLAGTTVYFDSTPAPVIFTSARQVAVVAPYNLAGKPSVNISVDYRGVASESVRRTVAAAVPALFTANGSGLGQVAAFNVDDTTGALAINNDGTPALRGSVVVLYATGDGLAGQDGQIVTRAASAVPPGWSVQIGGANATVLYAGPVVGLVSGITQINARVPTTATVAKNAPVQLTVNGVSSSTGVTLSIK
ncbi:MAG: hypothetical protein IT162_18215 [Bryobacterales bacterium]|nr:hypothetical protein [Bryobacterales bacterium]